MSKVNFCIFVFIQTYIHAGLHFPYIDQDTLPDDTEGNVDGGPSLAANKLLKSRNITENIPGLAPPGIQEGNPWDKHKQKGIMKQSNFRDRGTFLSGAWREIL